MWALCSAAASWYWFGIIGIFAAVHFGFLTDDRFEDVVALHDVDHRLVQIDDQHAGRRIVGIHGIHALQTVHEHGDSAFYFQFLFGRVCVDVVRRLASGVFSIAEAFASHRAEQPFEVLFDGAWMPTYLVIGIRHIRLSSCALV